MSVIIPIILIIETVFTLAILPKATAKLEDAYSLFSVFRCVCKYFTSLFENRNAFGTLLSGIVCILSIPCIIFIIAADILMTLLIFCKKIWELGSKK